MPRKLVNRSRVGSAIDNTLHDALKALSQETKIDKSKLLDEAVELLLIKYANGKAPYESAVAYVREKENQSVSV